MANEAVTSSAGGRAGRAFDNSWNSSLLRPAVIAALVGCIVIALIAFLRHVVPGMPSAYVNILRATSIGAALVGGYTTTVLVQPGQRQRRTLNFRLAEIGLILFVTRLVLWATVEGWPPARLMLSQPIGVLLTLGFVVNAILILIAWGMSVYVTSDFLAMGLQPDELLDMENVPRGATGYDHRIQSDRRALVNRFTERWALGGMLLIALTAGSQVGLGENGFFALARQQIAGSVIGAAVVYFLLGLLLLTFGHLAALRANWQLEKVPNESTVVRNWPFYALGLVLAVAVVAFLLPLGGTFRLAQLLGLLVQVLYGIVYVIMGGLMGLLALLFGASEEPVEEPTAAPPEFAPPPAPPAQTAEVPPWVGGSVFWVIMALLLGYAAYIYLQGRGVKFHLLLAWLRQFLRGWRQMQDAFGQWRAGVVAEEAGGEAPARRSRVRRWLDDLLLGRLSPDEQVRYFYLSTLENAAEQGLRRRPGETPHRFAGRLADKIESDEEASLSELTAGFVRVEFARQSTTSTALPPLKRAWTQIRAALAQLRSDAPAAEPSRDPPKNPPDPGQNVI